MNFHLFLAISLVALNPVFSIKKCDDFTPERIKELEEIARIGDLKLRSTLNISEYKILSECPKLFKANTINEYKKTVQKLQMKLAEFVRENPGIKEIGGPKEIKKEWLSEEGNLKMEKKMEIVMASKKLMANIFSDAGESPRIDLYSFMEDAHWTLLAVALKLSMLQSVELDGLINEQIWAKHNNGINDCQKKHSLNLENKENAINGGKRQPAKSNTVNLAPHRVLIAGAGPVGLLTAFKLFMAGMDVTIVDARHEPTRFQVVVFDMNWLAQMRFLLGTTFDKLFGIGKIGRLTGIWENRALISINNFETIVRQRLQKLAEFVKEKIGDERLKVILGYSVEEVESTNESVKQHYVAVLNKKESKKGSKQSPLKMEIPVDMVVCAGGANDQFRNKLFDSDDMLQQRSPPRNYGITRFMKPKGDTRITFQRGGSMKSEMSKMAKFLKAAKFDELINGKNGRQIPNEIKHLIEELAAKMEADGEQRFVNLETAEFISISYVTPKPMLELFKEIEAAKKANNSLMGEMDKLRQRVLWKWSKCVFAHVMALQQETVPSPKYQLNLDANGDISTASSKDTLQIDPIKGIFDLVIRTWKQPIRMHQSIIVAVVGDALASPHFYTGTGLCSGRMSVERLSAGIEKLLQGKIKLEQLIAELERQLNEVKEHVIKWAGKYIEIWPNNERKRKRPEYSNKRATNSELAKKVPRLIGRG